MTKNTRYKRILSSITTAIGILLLIDALIMATVANLNMGTTALAFLSVALIAYGILWNKSLIKKWQHVAIAIALGAFISFSSFLAFYGSQSTSQYNEEVVIVLGAGVRGEQVSNTLAYRLDKAVGYHAINPDALIVVSGGQGPQEDITEALAMERYLIEKGIPAKNIVKEENSTSTYENFVFSNNLLIQDFPQGYSVVFITNRFHVFRAERIAQYAGISTRHIGAPIDWYTVPTNYLRETMAVIKFLAFPPTIQP
jgi:uncharacterized SAM-binding protein YcdF (DUF218 family)